MDGGRVYYYFFVMFVAVFSAAIFVSGHTLARTFRRGLSTGAALSLRFLFCTVRRDFVFSWGDTAFARSPYMPVVLRRW